MRNVIGFGSGPGGFGLRGEDEVGSDLREEPLDGFAVGSVTHFPGQPENTGAARDGYPDPPVTALDLGVPVSG